MTARRDVMMNLWMPLVVHTGERKVMRQEVAGHNTFEDCWAIIRGKAYDLNLWKDRHPGGLFVARMHAGKEATAEFGEYHSAMAEKHMAHFCIGDLVEG